MLGAVDAAKNGAGGDNAPFKNAVPLSPLWSQLLDTCSEAPV